MKLFCCQHDIVWENKPANHAKVRMLLEAANIPHGWLATVKESIRSVAPRFSARRMVKQYVEGMYVPAIDRRTVGKEP